MARYKGDSRPPHGVAPKTGILLTNLGTPDAPTPRALRRYLAEFLGDSRVIETPKIFWWPVLHGIILRLRPRRSAKAYAKVWTAEGSPLLVNSRRQASAIANSLEENFPGPVRVELGMRYGNPSIRDALEALRASGVTRLLVFPLYPQYSATTTASSFDAVAAVLRTWRRLPSVRMLAHYHDDPGYIQALAESIRGYWARHGKPDRLLLSFHGLPRKNLEAGDPYYCECQKTARLVAGHLHLEDGSWAVAFQSRFGPMEWLQPYTADVLERWARAGIARVQVICPGFPADCLETLEEIQIQYREIYLAAGGRDFAYIPALNDDPDHIEALVNLILNNCRGWEGEVTQEELDASRERADKTMAEEKGMNT